MAANPCHPTLLTIVCTGLLLSACTIDPRPTPAPIENRAGTAAPGRPGTAKPGTVVVSPQPADPALLPRDQPAATLSPEPAADDNGIGLLLAQSEQLTADGDYPAAAAALERALRLNPKDPELWYQLAHLRLRQGEFDEAEDLATKSRSMAVGQPGLQARNWRLIAVTRLQHGDAAGADQAQQTAHELESRLR